MFRPSDGTLLRPRSNVAVPESRGPCTRESPRNAEVPARVSVDGKYFLLNGDRWSVRGLTYGPFAPNNAGAFLPAPSQVATDFRHIRGMGGNAVRVYHVPPLWLLDLAIEHDLRVFIDIPWEKHRCFFEDWEAQRDARQRVRNASRDLGGHPATFAISVANEFPTSIVRFYGKERLERFVGELLDVAKQEAPDCLVTFANYPPTEFLEPPGRDFACFNVYLEDRRRMRDYLRRLQHVAGALPLVLGECGSDSMRRGLASQARIVAGHVREVAGQDLAGAFVFSYTDDWYTGGNAVEDWAFGVTTCDRIEKPSARALRRAWANCGATGTISRRERHEGRWPRVSVVVCSYNGAATIEKCLTSLERLQYPDFKVILVDDGSSDDTPAIAARFPGVRCIRQDNKGLSVARNVGAEAATGEIVAYTDSDCVADPRWLINLVRAMRQQRVDAIGGPNIAPPADCWVAHCVAASPGGPSHVMLDDRYAEHVPGCNMAFRRDVLLRLGGFDAQFHQAGDDVDICWRLTDAGHKIGYAPGAIVWHHRRNTVRAYLAQQKGYGRAEAMLSFKHSDRFNWRGCSCWNGVIYGEGTVGLLTLPPRIYHGRFGSALFQMVYRHNEYSYLSYFTLLEWHALAATFAVFSTQLPALLIVSASMWALTCFALVRVLGQTRLPRGNPWWCLPLVMLLHLLQPIVRAWHRYRHRLSTRGRGDATDNIAPTNVKRVSFAERELLWRSTNGYGREELLRSAEREAEACNWRGFGGAWSTWDLALVGDPWVDVKVWTATEDLGGPRRFTRARVTATASPLALTVLVTFLAWAVVILLTPPHVAIELLATIATLAVPLRIEISRRRSLRRIAKLLWHAGASAGLEPVDVRSLRPPAPATSRETDIDQRSAHAETARSAGTG
jgi:GT2 family glycosyltransferase